MKEQTGEPLKDAKQKLKKIKKTKEDKLVV